MRAGDAMNARSWRGGELHELGVRHQVVPRQERWEVGSGRVVQLVEAAKAIDIAWRHAGGYSPRTAATGSGSVTPASLRN